MDPKLRNILITLGVVAVGGVSYEMLTPSPGTGSAVVTDAGLFTYPQARIRCPVRNLCPSLGARYGTWETCARDLRSVDSGFVFRWPNADGGGGGNNVDSCIELLGACDFTDDGGVGMDGFCAGDGGQGSRFPSQVTADLCACAAASTCLAVLLDGGMGPAPFGATLAPGTFTGTACVLKACVEVAGEQGQSWPGECPAVSQ